MRAKFTEAEIYMANNVNKMLKSAGSQLRIHTTDKQWMIGSFLHGELLRSDNYADVQKIAFKALDEIGGGK